MSCVGQSGGSSGSMDWKTEKAFYLVLFQYDVVGCVEYDK